ncbi:MAG TPA: HAD family hydrolase [Nocardioides sp.]|nr:HAD family hydrolase [Nocardioides sp.]
MASGAELDTVILDLDGTLVDTVYQHVLAWRSAFLSVGVDLPAWRIHRAIGIGGDRLVSELAGRAVENAVGDEVRQLHALRFEDQLPHVTPTEGASELLETLRTRDLKVVVASSGEKEMTERLLSMLGAAESLHAWVAGDQAENSKPEADLLHMAMEKVSGEAALVIGDTVWDVESARKADYPCVTVLTGGVSGAELREAGAVAVRESPAAIRSDLDDLLSRARR